MTSGSRGRVHGGSEIWGFLVVLGEPQFSYFFSGPATKRGIKNCYIWIELSMEKARGGKNY